MHHQAAAHSTRPARTFLPVPVPVPEPIELIETPPRDIDDVPDRATGARSNGLMQPVRKKREYGQPRAQKTVLTSRISGEHLGVPQGHTDVTQASLDHATPA